MTPIHALAKAILYVRDMDTQVCFYRDVLGLAVRNPAGLADYSDQYWVEFETGQCTLVLHGGGEGRIGADAPKLAFEVHDIHEARRLLSERGARMGEIRSPAPGVHVCDGIDPEGHAFSIDAHE